MSDPILSDILLEGILSVLESRPFSFALFPHRYQVLCQSQSTLGWSNLLKGFCSVHWQHLHDQFITASGITSRHSPPSILRHLHSVLDSILAIWKLRNDQRHGADTEFHESELSRQTVESIVDLYDLRDRVLPSDHHLFFDSVDEHLKKPQSSLRAWLTNHSDHLFRSHQQATVDNVTHTHPLTFYFNL